MRAALLALLPLALAACATPEQIAERERREEQQYLNALAARCSAFGVPAGSPEMRQCMLRLDEQHETSSTALGAAIIGSGLLNPTPAPVYQPYGVQTPLRTDCYTWSGTTRCYSR